jgi:hypothetical protein
MSAAPGTRFVKLMTGPAITNPQTFGPAKPFAIYGGSESRCKFPGDSGDNQEDHISSGLSCEHWGRALAQIDRDVLAPGHASPGLQPVSDFAEP